MSQCPLLKGKPLHSVSPCRKRKSLPCSSLKCSSPERKGPAQGHSQSGEETTHSQLLTQCCPEGSGRTPGDWQPQRPLCEEQLGYLRALAPRAVPETVKSTGPRREEQGPSPSGQQRKFTSRRPRDKAASLGRPRAGGIGLCTVAEAGTVEMEISTGLTRAQLTTLPSLRTQQM